MRVSGVVDRLFTKDWPGKNGKPGNTSHSFKVRGNDKFFRMGYNQVPNFRETDQVSFDADDKGYISNLEVSVSRAPEQPAQSAAAPKAAEAAVGVSGKAAQSRDGYWADKETRDLVREERYQSVVEPRITYCSAQSDAVKLVEVACQHDLLSFGNANKSAKLGLLLDYVDQVTNRFVQQRMNAAELINGITQETDDGNTTVGGGNGSGVRGADSSTDGDS